MNLKCQEIYKSYGDISVLRGVSVEFPETGAVAIIGPNGAGKTTLINIISGFLKADTGSCVLNTEEILHLPPHRIAQLGITRTFQDNRVINNISVLENLLLARSHQKHESLLFSLLQVGLITEEKRNRERGEEILHFVGLSEISNVLAKNLSFGQQKLLSLACCLATDAQIIVLDEPLSGLHPAMTDQVLTLIRRLVEDLKLVVFIEHNLAAVRQVADDVIVMDNGKIIAHGPPNTVLDMPEIVEAYLA